MTNKVYYRDRDVRTWVHSIIRQMNADNWHPDYVVGLTRGGLIPANMLSQYLEVPMETLKVSFRDDEERQDTSVWLADEAFEGKKILIVDDINDSGATLNWIKKDWMSATPNSHQRWDSVWNGSTRFAVLINNDASEFKDPTYVGKTINKLDNPEWCVFPWENWWE